MVLSDICEAGVIIWLTVLLGKPFLKFTVLGKISVCVSSAWCQEWPKNKSLSITFRSYMILLTLHIAYWKFCFLVSSSSYRFYANFRASYKLSHGMFQNVLSFECLRFRVHWSSLNKLKGSSTVWGPVSGHKRRKHVFRTSERPPISWN